MGATSWVQHGYLWVPIAGFVLLLMLLLLHLLLLLLGCLVGVLCCLACSGWGQDQYEALRTLDTA